MAENKSNDESALIKETGDENVKNDLHDNLAKRGLFGFNGPDEHQKELIQHNMDTLAATVDDHFGIVCDINAITQPAGTAGANITFSKYLATSYKVGYDAGMDADELRFSLEQLVLEPLVTKAARIKGHLDKLDFRTDGLIFYNQHKLPALAEIDWNIKNLDRFVTWSKSATGPRTDKEISAHLGILKYNLEASNKLGLHYRMVGRYIIVGPETIAAERERLQTLTGIFNRGGMGMDEAMFTNRKFQEWHSDNTRNSFSNILSIFGGLADQLVAERSDRARAFELPRGDEKWDVNFGKPATSKSDTSSDCGSSGDDGTVTQDDKPVVFSANKGDDSPTASEDGYRSPHSSGSSSPNGSKRRYLASKGKKSKPKSLRALNEEMKKHRDKPEHDSVFPPEPKKKHQKTQHATDATSLGSSGANGTSIGFAEGMTLQVTECEGDLFRLKLVDSDSDSGSDESFVSAAEVAEDTDEEGPAEPDAASDTTVKLKKEATALSAKVEEESSNKEIHKSATDHVDDRTSESHGAIKDSTGGADASGSSKPVKRIDKPRMQSMLAALLDSTIEVLTGDRSVKKEANSASQSDEMGSGKESASDDIAGRKGKQLVDRISSKVTAKFDGTEAIDAASVGTQHPKDIPEPPPSQSVSPDALTPKSDVGDGPAEDPIEAYADEYLASSATGTSTPLYGDSPDYSDAAEKNKKKKKKKKNRARRGSKTKHQPSEPTSPARSDGYGKDLA